MDSGRVTGVRFDYQNWLEWHLRLNKTKSFKVSLDKRLSVISIVSNQDLTTLKEKIGPFKFFVELIDGNNYNKNKRKINKDSKLTDLASIFNELSGHASADYIIFFDGSYELEQDFFPTVLQVIEKNSWDLIYFDNDFVNDNKFFDPILKPDCSTYLLYGFNYILSGTVVNKEFFKNLNGFDSKYGNYYLWHFYIKAMAEKAKCFHVPKVLVHQKYKSLDSASVAKLPVTTFKRMILSSKNQENVNIKVTSCGDNCFNVSFHSKKNTKVSVIIPFRDKPELLIRAINSIKEKETQTAFELITINNSSSKETLQALDQYIEKNKIINLNYPMQFNWAKINNYASTYASGEILLFLNNDVMCKTKDPLTEIAGILQDKDVAVVGAKLINQENKCQHAGIVLNLEDLCEHAFRGVGVGENSYLNLIKLSREVSAVTGAVFAVKKDIFIQMGGFDERFSESFGDVDFCLKCQKIGKKVIYCATAEFYHPEFSTRIKKRETKAGGLFLKKWYSVLKKGDPYYNRNFSLKLPGFQL